jgi:hypothetical protein
LLLPRRCRLLRCLHLLLQCFLQVARLLCKLAAALVELRRTLLVHLGCRGCGNLGLPQLMPGLLGCRLCCCCQVGVGLQCCCFELVELLLQSQSRHMPSGPVGN